MKYKVTRKECQTAIVEGYSAEDAVENASHFPELFLGSEMTIEWDARESTTRDNNVIRDEEKGSREVLE